MIPEAHALALRVLVGRLAGEPILWALTGSTSFALQGVPVEPHDIDLQTDAQGAYALAACFADRVTRPVAFSGSEAICSHFGALSIEGIEVEIMGALQKRLPDGTWEDPVDVAAHRRWIVVEDLRVPVLDLAYEARAYRVMGRMARAELLEEWLAGGKDA